MKLKVEPFTYFLHNTYSMMYYPTRAVKAVMTRENALTTCQ